jgi:hypothetical protein
LVNGVADRSRNLPTDISYSGRLMVENSSHADSSYRDMWNIPPLHFGPVHPLSGDDVATIKPKRHKSVENNDQVRRTLAKIFAPETPSQQSGLPLI